MKKIVITGPHCCGKSTVIKRIEEDINKDNDIRLYILVEKIRRLIILVLKN